MQDFVWGPLLAEGPLFIGILNVTPDSFSDGGRFQSVEAALSQARRLIESGAGMLDVGAESTRPGAASVSAGEEWARLEPVLQGLRETFPTTPLSLDTRHASVAEQGLKAGAAMMNDVTGFTDPAMLDLAQTSGCGLIAMRSRQEGGGFYMPPYEGPGQPVTVAIQELRAVRDRLTLEAGIDPARILLDPGFGFGTTFQEDGALWAALPQLPTLLAWPAQGFCLGISRKRFLAWRQEKPNLSPLERDQLTTEAHREALTFGYQVFRTHEVR